MWDARPNLGFCPEGQDMLRAYDLGPWIFDDRFAGTLTAIIATNLGLTLLIMAVVVGTLK